MSNKIKIEPNRILIIEDQKSTLDSISYAIKKVILKDDGALPRFGNYPIEEVEKELRERGIYFARFYIDADKIIKNTSKNYNLVFLDHRMPLENDQYSEIMHNIGYSLIKSIKKYHHKAKIIGTSSFSPNDLRDFEKPDFHLDKTSIRTIDKDLDAILKQIDVTKTC